MKNYNVTIETSSEVLSSFQIKALNIKEARKLAQFQKRRAIGGKGNTSRTIVRPAN